MERGGATVNHGRGIDVARESNRYCRWVCVCVCVCMLLVFNHLEAKVFIYRQVISYIQDTCVGYIKIAWWWKGVMSCNYYVCACVYMHVCVCTCMCACVYMHVCIHSTCVCICKITIIITHWLVQLPTCREVVIPGKPCQQLLVKTFTTSLSLSRARGSNAGALEILKPTATIITNTEINK